MGEIASKGQLRASFLRWTVVTVPLILLLGFASASLAPSGSGNRWYAALIKPEVMPPEWAFPWVWSALYVLLGVALAMVANARGSRYRGIGLVLFFIQLFLNLAWSPLFFGQHQVSAALIVIAVMLVMAIATTFMFGWVRRGAAWLMVPYLAWLSVALLLNLQIDLLNPEAETLVPSSSSTQILL